VVLPIVDGTIEHDRLRMNPTPVMGACGSTVVGEDHGERFNRRGGSFAANNGGDPPL